MPNNKQYSLSIAKQQITTLPVSTFKGEISIIETPSQAAEAIAFLKTRDLLGFDTETKPSFKKGTPNKVALMQLSTDDHCFLFRLNKLGITDEMASLLEDASILKIGLSIHDDFHVMHRSSDVEPRGFIELQAFVKDYGIADTSLQKVYAIIFGEKISKNQRLTNWEAPTLTTPQQIYAATDAWACLRIYKHLVMGRFDPAKFAASQAPDPAQNENS
ncbi:MAG: 3'-5' exonuclease domain-containing protein 2 [Bacteroidales bacterium]|nr:3'-5' exonuclease domain-containing protein 2 [Bacteroidales bacterium]